MSDPNPQLGPAVAGSAPVACPACGHENREGARFCDACGQAVAAPGLSRHPVPPPRLTAQLLRERTALASSSGERKIITSLFADIKGAVELMQDLDPEAASEIVDPILDMMIETIHEFDGYVDKCTGDGILALFGAPVAQEDHAQRAALAALSIQAKIARYAEGLRRDNRPAVRTRIGLNSGEAVLRAIRKDDLRAEYTPIGHATNLASRLEALAPPGGVLASESTFRLADGFVEFLPAGAVPVKGMREPVPTYLVVGVGPLRTRFQRATRRGLSPFTGRDAELSQMQRALEQAHAGHGQVVALVGEPGIGKSRLFHELIVAAQPRCLVLEAHCVQHRQSSAYLPIIALLRDLFGIVADDEQDVGRRKVADHVAGLDPALEDAVPYLQHLLEATDLTSPIRQMDAGIRRQRTLEAVKRLLLRESVRRPLVLAFEDLQWIDSSSQAMLDSLVEAVHSAPLLLLANYRPEYRHEWGSATHYTQLSLEVLASADGSQMLSTLLGDDPALDDVKRLIVERSEGNPFFIEEIVQTLFDRGVLERQEAGVVLASPLAIQIPETVQGVLAARIDGLPDGQRQVLQMLAVIGRAFSRDLAERVVEIGEDELGGALDALKRAGFIYERPTMAGTSYIFKHALTQMVAYETLLGRARRELHERVALAIEEMHAARVEDHYGELAHHFRLGGNAPKAVGFLQLAAGQAVQRSAHQEAVEHFTTALDLLSTLPEGPERVQRELAIQVPLGPQLALTRGYADPAAGRALMRAQELCQQVGTTPQLFPVLFGLWAFHLVRGDLRPARELGAQLLDLAQSGDDPGLLLEAHRALGATMYFDGHLTQAREQLDAGLRLYDPKTYAGHAFVFGQDPGVSCLAYLAHVQWQLGYPDAAERTAGEAVDLARRIAHPFSLAFALDMGAAVHHFRRRPDRALELAEDAIAVSAEHGFPLWSAFGKALRSWALVHHHARDAQPGDLHDALRAWRATGAGICGPYLLGLIAEAHVERGEFASGVPLVDEALDRIQASGERFWEAEILRLRGRLLMATERAPQSDIEACLRSAAAIAREQESRALELRAASTLGPWLAVRGETDEAVAMLRGPLRAFTEGFDTGDLQEAERLLGVLSGYSESSSTTR
jgi:class 3 adenylate cyclase/tetratricopeptide (TPR) repeat protein